MRLLFKTECDFKSVFIAAFFCTYALFVSGCYRESPTGNTETGAASSRTFLQILQEDAILQKEDSEGLIQTKNQPYQTLTFCRSGGENLFMDLYPSQDGSGLAPAVIYIHGGGWTMGDKHRGTGTIFLPELHRRGYVVAAINYRLAPRYKFPAQIEDVKCAIRFLRAHASEFNIDPNRIGLIGGSAGGHLASLSALTRFDAGFDIGEYLDVSSQVQAVVDLFGPSDLPDLFSKAPGRVVKSVFDADSLKDPILKLASPVNCVHPDAPPFLIMQGDKDILVPISQSETFYKKLKENGVKAELIVVQNAGHGFRPKFRKEIQPSRDILIQRVADFFDSTLN
jgi:acetyl esterase/lipase